MTRLYAATVGAGLFRSDDVGAGWIQEPGLPASARLYSLCAAPGELLAGGVGRVYRHAEHAWGELALPDPEAEVWALAVADGVILAGTHPLGLFRSDDGGRSWEALAISLPPGSPPGPPPRVTALLPNPWVAGEVWASVEIGGVLASADAGRTWSAASQGLPSLDVHGLAWASGGVLLAATPQGIAMWRSGRWIEGRFEPADRYCRALAARPDDPSTLYCGFGDGPPGTRGGIAISIDGGRSWQASGLAPGADTTIWSVATASDRTGLVLACALSGRVFVSLDGATPAAVSFATGAETRAVACLAE